MRKNSSWTITIVCLLLLVAGIGWFFNFYSYANEPASKAKRPLSRNRANWKIVFEENFEGSQLDSNAWSSINRGLSWNEEDQAYVEQNASLSGGNLVLTTKKEAWEGLSLRSDTPYQMITREYTSALVHTKQKRDWLYGRFEVSAKPAKSNGMIYTLWMLPSNDVWPPEMDIMEVLGDSSNTVHMTNHWGKQKRDKHKINHGIFKDTVDYTRSFHTYAMEWEPGVIRWYVDGVKRHESTNHVPDTPCYLIFSPAVGSVWTGPPNSLAIFPNKFLIDWVKVYQRDTPL